MAEKAWTFQFVFQTFDNGKEVAAQGGGLACTVDEVVTSKTAAASSVHCVSSGGDTLEPRQARGIFVATNVGLWQVCEGYCKQGIGDLARLVAGLDPKTQLLPATPGASTSVEWRSSDGGELIKQTTSPYEGGTCITTTKVAGNGWILCLREGKAIVGGRGFDHANPTLLSSFGESPPL